jgi:hypothetical protein
LSHHKHGFFFSLTPGSSRTASAHIISVVAFAIDLYSSSELDHDTAACFLELQETKFGPTNMLNPLVDLLSSRLPAQSAYENAFRRVDDDCQKVIPSFAVLRT